MLLLSIIHVKGSMLCVWCQTPCGSQTPEYIQRGPARLVSRMCRGEPATRCRECAGASQQHGVANLPGGVADRWQIPRHERAWKAEGGLFRLAGQGQFAAGDGALEQYVAPEAEQFGGPAGGAGSDIAGVFHQRLLFDQAPEILLMQAAARQRFDGRLQLQQGEGG